jgi:hypothetical protein
MEYPRSQEEIYDAMLRGFLQFAEGQIRIAEFDHGRSKLDNYHFAKDRLNQMYDLVTKIQMHGMFNEHRKEMSLKVINLFTEITKIEGDKFLKHFILN